MGWQWHQLDHMQIICTSLQTDNHASTPPLSDPDRHQNLTICSLTHCQPSLKISCKSVNQANMATSFPFVCITTTLKWHVYLANSTDKRVFILELCVVIRARWVENTPALRAFQHGARSVAVITVPVMIAHSLHITYSQSISWHKVIAWNSDRMG